MPKVTRTRVYSISLPPVLRFCRRHVCCTARVFATPYPRSSRRVVSPHYHRAAAVLRSFRAVRSERTKRENRWISFFTTSRTVDRELFDDPYAPLTGRICAVQTRDQSWAAVVVVVA